MRVRVSVDIRMKSRLDRCTGARTNGPWAGMCSRPRLSRRKQSLARPKKSPRIAPYALRSSRVGGWTSTGSMRGGAGSASASGSGIDSPGQVDDDLVDGHVTRVELDGVVGLAQRVSVAALVEGVATRHVGGHGLVVEIGDLRGPALGPNVGPGGQVHLEDRVRKDDRADVTPLQHAATSVV